MAKGHQEKSLIEILKDNNLSISVLKDETHPDFPEQRQKLIQIIQSGEITEKRIEALCKSIPSANEALKGVSKNATESQIALIDSIRLKNSSAYTVIEKIVQDAETDDLRREALLVAERMSKSDNETMKEVSKDNNKVFKYVTTAIVFGLVLIAGGAMAKSALSK